MSSSLKTFLRASELEAAHGVVREGGGPGCTFASSQWGGLEGNLPPGRVVVGVVDSPLFVVAGVALAFTVGWHSEGHDAPGGSYCPPCPSRRCGEKSFLEEGISTMSEAISERCANHGKRS